MNFSMLVLISIFMIKLSVFFFWGGGGSEHVIILADI